MSVAGVITRGFGTFGSIGLIITAGFLSEARAATTWYADPAATGANDGTSQTDAWSTVAAIKTYATGAGFVAGDSVLFKRGQIFYDPSGGANGIVWGVSGTAGNVFTVGAYGTGADPVIHFAGPNDIPWALHSGTVYKWNAGLTASNNGLWENSLKLRQASSVANITAGSYFFDHDGTDPGGDASIGTYYYRATTGVPSDHNVTRGLNKRAFVFSDKSYWTVEDLHFRGGANAILCDAPAANVSNGIVQDCVFTDLRQGVDATGSASFEPSFITVQRCTSNGVISLVFAGSAVVGKFCDNFTIANNNVQSVDEEDLNLMRFKNIGSWQGREALLGGQNMRNLVLSGNSIVGAVTLAIAGTPYNAVVLWNQVGVAQQVNNRITGNYIHDLEGEGIIVGASATVGATQDAVINNNIVVNAATTGIVVNINNSANEALVYHNTIHKCGTNFRSEYGRGYIYRDNLSSLPTNYHVDLDAAVVSIQSDYNGFSGASTGTKFRIVTTDYNFANWKTQTSADANSYDATPTYTGGANPTTAVGFKQDPNSNVLGKGKSISGFNTDYEGVGFDCSYLGAFAFLTGLLVDTRQKRTSAVSLVTISRVPGVDNTSLNPAERKASTWSYAFRAAMTLFFERLHSRIRKLVYEAWR